MRAFDIFARLPNGSLIWLECFEGLAKAHRRVKELAKSAPPHYLIYSEVSGLLESEDHSNRRC
jgi:hypothetical protein